MPEAAALKVAVSSFEGWYHHQLARKFYREMDRVGTAMRPLLLFYSQLSRLCSDFADVLRGDLLSLQPALDSILHLIGSLTGSLPECMDYYFLKGFCRASAECISNICTHLHAFSHPEDTISEYEVQEILLPRIKQISTLLRNHPILLQAFERDLVHSSASLKHIGRLKTLFVEDLEILTEQLKAIQESKGRVDDFQALSCRYQQLQEEYDLLSADEEIKRRWNLLKQIERCEFHLNALTEPLFRGCQQLKSRKRTVKEDTILLAKDYHVIHEFSNVMQRSLLYPYIRQVSSLEEFQHFLELLCQPIVQEQLSLSRKTLLMIEELQRNWDMAQWGALFQKWGQLLTELEKLESDPVVATRIARLETIRVEYEEVRQSYLIAYSLYQEDAENYNFFLENWSNFCSRAVSQCKEEFNVVAEITFEGIPTD